MPAPNTPELTFARAHTGPQDAAGYLTQLQSRDSSSALSARGASSPSRSSSLISYDTASTRRRDRANSDAANSDASTDSERSTAWRGVATVMPTPSSISATRLPTTSFDIDFVPNPEDPYSLRHSEYGYDVNPAHRTISQHIPGASLKASDEEPSVWVYLHTYLSCASSRDCGSSAAHVARN